LFSYAQVETILVAAYKIKPSAKGAFRGRIKHFQRLGIVPSSPGKGRKIAYERKDIYAWALCLEFAEFGMDPTIAREFFKHSFPLIDALLHKKNLPKYLVFYPNVVSGWINDKLGTTGRASFVTVPSPNLRSLDALVGMHAERAGVINLIHIRTAIEAAIAVLSN
jgi:hypothetical protein